MAVVKCKMCGGDLQIYGDERYGTCAYCGTVVTLPNVVDANTENLFMRAEQLRHMKQFDKALATYNSIINILPADPEAHWGALLSRYGIEYVEDPVSHQRIPTCHRVQNSPITSDSDYIASVNNAPDSYAKELYEFEAQRIFEIQKDILTISSKEEPYDVFICYKENTEGGIRTKDSIIAQDIYDNLTDAGLKVFFARITLEGKLGSSYEPIIFAALNSAHVMLVIGTTPEFVNSTWVRNEWSRFLLIMRNEQSKVLIPCYQGMNPYDFPEELKIFQAQDMSKIGFMQDLLAGIKGIITSRKNLADVEVEEKVNYEEISEWTLVAENAVKNENFAEADLLADRILQKDSKNIRAMLVKILISYQVTDCHMLTPDELKKSSFYAKIMRYADADFLKKINAVITDNRIYFYSNEEKIRRGPFSKVEIITMLSNGILNAKTQVFNSRNAIQPISLSQFIKNSTNLQEEKKRIFLPLLRNNIRALLLLLVFGIAVGGYYIKKSINTSTVLPEEKNYPAPKFTTQAERKKALEACRSELTHLWKQALVISENARPLSTKRHTHWGWDSGLMNKIYHALLKYNAIANDKSEKFNKLKECARLLARKTNKDIADIAEACEFMKMAMNQFLPPKNDVVMERKTQLSDFM